MVLINFKTMLNNRFSILQGREISGRCLLCRECLYRASDSARRGGHFPGSEDSPTTSTTVGRKHDRI